MNGVLSLACELIIQTLSYLFMNYINHEPQQPYINYNKTDRMIPTECEGWAPAAKFGTRSRFPELLEHFKLQYFDLAY